MIAFEKFLKEEMIQLTKDLVAIPSVNSTAGESKIGDFIANYIRDIPYFKENPDYVSIAKLKDDVLERKNVIALLKGNGKSNKTLIFHGHTDTVGVKDYGRLEEYAFDCDGLIEALETVNLAEDIKKDLDSGDYLFGRGTCDMKSGDAVFLVLLKYLSEKAELINGNIMVSFNPVEENLHTGVIESLPIYSKFKHQYGLEYVMAVNNDFTCPMYPGDQHRYIYAGAVGKLLPCFYIMGKETHVGQCFEGLDASMIGAKIVEIMNCNPKFCDGYNGEYTLPPSVLKMKDMKDFYNVQTAYNSFVYFNYFVHNKSMDEIVGLLKVVASEAMAKTIEQLDCRFKEYSALSGLKYEKLDYQTNVKTYDQLYGMAKQVKGDELEELLATKMAEIMAGEKDQREIACQVVKWLTEVVEIHEPGIVLFFAPPYCPHNTLKKEVQSELDIYEKLEDITSELGEEVGEVFKFDQFFPSLSDSSYIKIDDTEESIKLLVDNFPGYETLYPLPFKEMKQLDIPAVNFGVYGKDAHKWTERVSISYSFETLPKLILKTIDKFLG